MPKHLSLRYLPLTWSGLAFVTLVFAFLGSIVRGDPRPLLEKWGVSIDVFAMTMHEIGLLLGMFITLQQLSARGVKMIDLGIKRVFKTVWIIYALVGFATAMLLYPVIETIMEMIGIKMLWWNEEGLTYSSLTDWCLVTISATIIAPIVEELFFRGYLLTAFLEKIRNTPLAVCMSSLVFTSIHVFIGPGMMIYIFLWSLIPSYLYLKTGSLYSSILMHALNNAFAYLILPMFL